MRSGLTILLLFYSLLSTGQDLFKYTPGISFNVESTYPQATGNKYEYFTTSYGTGFSFNMGMTNKLNYKKLFVRVNANLGFLGQSQKFTFSNEIDNIIEHTVDYQLPYWSLDYSIGRDFKINDLNTISMELGFSTIGDFKSSNLGSEIYQSGSFESEYVGPDDHSDGISSQEYQYELSYEWQVYLSPFIRCSLSLPSSKHRMSIGLIGRLNNIQYDTFINISGGNYSAIAMSSLVGGSMGLCIDYEF